MDFDPTPCKHSGVRLLEIVPPSRGVRVAGDFLPKSIVKCLNVVRKCVIVVRKCIIVVRKYVFDPVP